jgi:hypothetical protein
MVNFWLWEKIELRAEKFAGTWLLEKYGFSDVSITGKHFAVISLKSKSNKVRHGTLCLYTGKLSFFRKKELSHF